MYFFSVEMYIQYYDRCTFSNYVIYLSSKQVNSLRAYASENCQFAIFNALSQFICASIIIIGTHFLLSFLLQNSLFYLHFS